MTLLNTTTRYGALGQSLHWLTVVFVGAAYLLGEEGPESRVYAPERAATLALGREGHGRLQGADGPRVERSHGP